MGKRRSVCGSFDSEGDLVDKREHPANLKNAYALSDSLAGWRVFWIGLLLVFLVGCEAFGTEGGHDDMLDERLQALLIEASGGRGINFFMLPESDEFIAIPQDPKNPITAEKVALGQLLFHETGLMTGNELPEGRFSASCASCHFAQAGFQAGVPQAIGEGGLGFGERGEARMANPEYPLDSLDVQPIRAQAALNMAWQSNTDSGS